VRDGPLYLGAPLSGEELEEVREVGDILEDVVECLDVLLGKGVLEALKEAEEDVKEGRVINWEEFLEKIK